VAFNVLFAQASDANTAMAIIKAAASDMSPYFSDAIGLMNQALALQANSTSGSARELQTPSSPSSNSSSTNVTATVDKSNLRVVSLTYKRSWWAFSLALIIQNATLVIAISCTLAVILVLYCVLKQKIMGLRSKSKGRDPAKCCGLCGRGKKEEKKVHPLLLSAHPKHNAGMWALRPWRAP